MAFRQTVTYNNGLVIPNCYQRVEGVMLPNKNKVAFVLNDYVDPQKDKVFGKAYECNYDLNGGNPIAQAYEHLKTLPEFANAIDC